MIITKLILSEFGRHQTLNVDTGGNIIGLTGPNGAGKSTVLEAVKFALTGEMADRLETYVRHDAGNASVELQFTSHGQQGVIFRQVGKTPKRWLKWDGQTIKAAREVDRIMSTIFGAEKRAVANAVFVTQGMLHKILFSDDADRRSMFIQLLNLGYLNSRATRLTRFIETQSREIQDNAPLLDQATQQVREHEKTVAELKSQLVQLPDLKDLLSLCRQRQSWAEQLAQLQFDYSAEEAKETNVKAQLMGMSESQYQELLKQEEALRLAYDQADADYRKWCAIQPIAIALDLDKQTRNNLDREIEGIMAKWGNATPLSQAQQIRDQWIQEATKCQMREDWLKNVQYVKQCIQQLQIELQKCPDLEPMRQQVQQLMSQRSTAEAILRTLYGYQTERMELRQCRDKMTAQDGMTLCHKCGLKLPVSSLDSLSDEAMTDLRLQIEAAEKQYRQFVAQYNETSQRLSMSEVEQQRLKDQLRDREQEVERLQKAEVICHPSPDQVRQSVEDSKNYCEEYAAVLQRRDALQQQRDEVNRRLLGYVIDLEAYQAGQPFTAEANQQRAAVVQQHKKNWQDLHQQIEPTRQNWQTLQQVQQRLNDLGARWRALNQQMQQTTLSVESTMGPDYEQADLMVRLAMVSQKQTAREQLQGKLHQAEVTLRQAEAYLYEERQRQLNNQTRLQLVNDLRSLKDMLQDDGLPLEVGRHFFKKLTKLTQGLLTDMDCDFRIMEDPDNALSYQFVRTDEPEHDPLPMNKLSGGQRVKLCVCFLIAVQQCLVKEVGLLVLDEPSTHVDHQGVVHLTDMLQQLQYRLHNTETQVWVCDHNPELERCFDYTIRLT